MWFLESSGATKWANRITSASYNTVVVLNFNPAGSKLLAVLDT